MKTSLSLILLGLLSVSCMTAKDKEIFAEVFDKDPKAEQPVLAEPAKSEEKVKKAEGAPLIVN